MVPGKKNYTPKKNKKDRYLQVRLDSETFDLIDLVAKRFNFNKSEMVRKALQYFIVNIENSERHNPKILVAQDIFRDIMDTTSTDFLKIIAKKSFEHSLSDKMFFERNFKDKVPRRLKTDDFESYMNVLSDIFLQKEGNYWFEKISTVSRPNRFTISGEHYLGEKFSLYFKYFTMEFAKWGNYRLIREEHYANEYEDDEAQFRLPSYSLMLVFAPIKRKNPEN